MGTRTLGQNLHAEVGIRHLLLVVLFTLLAVVLQVQAFVQSIVSQLELAAFFFQTALDDLSTSQQSLLQTAERLILHRNGRLFLEWLVQREREFTQDGYQIVLIGGLLLLAFTSFLTLVHLLTGLSVNAHL